MNLKFISILFLATLIGCSTKPIEFDNHVTSLSDKTFPSIIQWSSFGNSDYGLVLWYIEASKKFEDPIIFACHGDSLFGIWMAIPDPPRKMQPVSEIAKTLRNIYKDKQIFLIVCNTGNHSLNIENIWYSKKSIYVIPDSYCKFERIKTDKSTGSIDEFITAKTIPLLEPQKILP